MRQNVLIISLIFLLTAICKLCPAQQSPPQLQHQVTSEKKITSKVDTLIVTGKDFLGVNLFISNENAADTLLWRTNNDTTYRTLYPHEWYQLSLFLKTVFRKAKKSSDTIFSRLWAN